MATASTVQLAAIETATQTAREYLRVSKGKGRTARSIRDQHSDNVEAEREYGPWTWGEAYQDTGSASKFARKVRDDFEKLVADLRTGAFGAERDVLVLWEISRLARETGRGVEIIDLCEAGGYLIHITSHERTYNPRNYNDRHELISGIADAEREARRLSKRTLRGLNSAAREGRPQGQVPFGYARDYEVIDRRPRPVAQYPDKDEGPLVAELFVRVAGLADNRLGDDSVPLLYTNKPRDGGLFPEPMYAIAKEWEERGIISRDRIMDGELVPGGPFSPQSLRSMLLRPSYAGLRKHKGTIVPIQWEGWTPIVSLELFQRVQKVLADPSRRMYTGEHIRHALTMTMRCDVCGAGVGVVTRRHRRKRDLVGYQCVPRGHVWVSKEETDRILIGDLDPVDPDTGEALPPTLGLILSYLAAPDRYAALRRPPQAIQAEAPLRDELERLKAELKELEEAPAPKTARARIRRTSDMEELEEEIAEVESRLSALMMPAPLAALLPADPIKNVVRWWKSAGVEKQRAIVGVLLTPALLGEVRILPSPKTGRVPTVERIVFRRETVS